MSGFRKRYDNGLRLGGVQIRWIPTLFHAICDLVGAIAGVAAAIYIYGRMPSWALAVFVFVMVAASGHAVANIVASEYKVQRIVLYALMLAAGVGLLYGSYTLWSEMWVAVIVGFLGCAVAYQLLGQTVFADIYGEDAAYGPRRSWLREEEWGEPGPYDFVPRWRRRKGHKGA